MKISTKKFPELKTHFDIVLNKDKTHFKSSNDEPTPIGLIEEMYAPLPVDFWERENLEILDPCCGNGNFGLVAWNSLKKAGKTDKDIMENILHFNDISNVRLDNVKDIFCADKFKLNVSSTDFLKSSSKHKYDLVVANPPYAKMTAEGKRASKNHTLIRDFIIKSMEVLKDDGYLIFIVPDNWMSLADRNTVATLLTENQFVHLNIHQAKKWFPKIGSSFTWFVVQKTNTKLPYTVCGKYKGSDYTSSLLPESRGYIPLIWTSEVQSIVKKTLDVKGKKFIVETTSDLHAFTKKQLLTTEQDIEHSYKLHHTVKQKRWSSRPHKFQNGWKVFIATTDRYKLFVDNCGMTQSIAFIRCKDKAEAVAVKATLEHPLYKFLNDICRWGNFNNIRILQKLPIPSNPNDIWKSFDITEDEITFIKKYE